LRRTLSVCLSVRPVIAYFRKSVTCFRQPCGRAVSFFVYMSGPHIVRRSQPHKLVLINGIVKYTSTLRCYGCELWLLSNKSIDEFAVAWRRAVRRVLCLPSGTHCNLLPLLNEYLPVSLDVCKRSARFILSCLKSKSKVVRLVASFSVLFGRYESIIASNAIFAVHSSTGTFLTFSCPPLIPVIKFCIIIICMMLMTAIGWLN